jgi:hypothetical protein
MLRSARPVAILALAAMAPAQAEAGCARRSGHCRDPGSPCRESARNRLPTAAARARCAAAASPPIGNVRGRASMAFDLICNVEKKGG